MSIVFHVFSAHVMPTNFFYVYAIKDPRSSPAKPFYIGKGTGSRAFDHLVSPDKTKKYARIKEIINEGRKPLIDILVEDLTEAQALRLEAELIASFGTEETGGILANAIVPSGIGGKQRDHVVVPHGSVERAQLGLELLKNAVFELVKANPNGITNSDAASLLGLRSDYKGKQKDYLSYSVLGLLLREGRIERHDGPSRHVAKS
ncbi:MAG: GIY-YIG nuclease family protein [Lysobacteraceae bacterium]